MFESRYMPCETCGESVARASADAHECAPERLADFQMFALRGHVATFESSFRGYLDSAHGRFAVWLAARHVRATG